MKGFVPMGAMLTQAMRRQYAEDSVATQKGHGPGDVDVLARSERTKDHPF